MADYERAENECIYNGGHLAYVDSAFSNSYILESVKNLTSSDFWIGAKRYKEPMNAAVSNIWIWTDQNRIISFSDWGLNEPSEGRDCGVMSTTDGSWYSSSCSSKRPYVCSFPTTKSYCDEGWTQFTKSDSCYKVFYYSNWTRAEETCVEQNAHLTSIHSPEEDEFIVGLSHCGVTFTGAGDSGFLQDTWIGLYTKTSRPGEYSWSDGTTVNYVNWRPSQPNAQGWQCILLNSDPNQESSTTSGWDDWECSHVLRNFVCKKPTTKVLILH
uniref:C-type lectin domain-containing protein n=1 Tax=Panagrolaimus sp. JU765 TaxID=591449 RepID=A0AC34PWY4_9BILA